MVLQNFLWALILLGSSIPIGWTSSKPKLYGVCTGNRCRRASILSSPRHVNHPYEDERQGVFKRADVYKMHTYRDAITDAQSAWVMYPGTLFQRFDADEKGAVGAIPVKPGQLEELHRHISSLLRV
jgi:hypothetical protein